MPREMFPVASIMVSAYHMIPMYVIMIIACLFVGWHPDMTALLAAVMSLAIVLIWGLGVALLLSAWNVFFRDTQNVVDVIQTLITWTTPMIYPFGIVMDKLEQAQPLIYQIYLANPLCIAVLLNNRAFWIPTSSHPAEAAAQELPAHLFERGAIMIVAGLLFVVARPGGLRPARAAFRGEALMPEAIVVDGVTKRFKIANHKTVRKLDRRTWSSARS